jgi:hypothetical protein
VLRIISNRVAFLSSNATTMSNSQAQLNAIHSTPERHTLSRWKPIAIRILAIASFTLCSCGGGSASEPGAAQASNSQPSWSRSLDQDYGSVTAKSLQKGVDDAAQWLKANPDGIATISVPEGRFDFSDTGTQTNAIDLSSISPSGKGRLVIAGKGPDRTVLIFNNNVVQFYGRSTNHVTIDGFHFTTNQLTVSQGRVISASTSSVRMEILPGFPLPSDIFNANSNSGRYLRRYTDDPAGPQLIEVNNTQIVWSTTSPVSGRMYDLSVSDPTGQTKYYSVGALVCIKSKSDGQTYWFSGSSDLIFKNIRWTRISRGVFRLGSKNISIIDSSIERDPEINGYMPCLSSAAGGPQFGQPSDPATSGNIVIGFTAMATGDDSIAFFNSSGSVENVTISDSFARGILLNNSPDVTIVNAKLTRNPLLKM